MARFVYALNWEGEAGDREYFWTGHESQADARQDDIFEVSFPGKITRAELEAYCNENWSLPLDDEGNETEDLRNFNGIDAYGFIFNEGYTGND